MTPAGYHAYLLRLWRTQDDGQGLRIILQSVETGEKRSFTSLEALASYLSQLGVDEEARGKEASDGIETQYRDN